MKLILEQRYLFDGSAASVGHHAAHADHHDPLHPDHAPPAAHAAGDHAAPPALAPNEAAPDPARTNVALSEPAAHATTVLVVDPRVTNWQNLAASVKPDTQVVVLDLSKDGVSQVTQALQGLSNVRNLEFLTDGTPGAISLGGTTLDAATLTARAAEITGWSGSFSSHADIVFWGCDVAQGSAGATFMADMHTLTGATIGASDQAVGSSALGGTWTLDVTTGRLHGDAIPFGAEAMASYTGILDTPNPVVTLSASGTLPHEAPGTVLLGDSINVSMTFANTAQNATGYAPFVELFAPSALTLSTPTYAGSALTTLSATVDGTGHFTNPLTQQVEVAPGGITSGVVYVIQLPYGSFTPNEPSVTINASFGMSNGFGLVGQTLPIEARGGFQYGAVATGGTPIVGSASVGNETVTLIESWLTASTMYGEGETATGPDFPVSYTLNLEPAPAVAATGHPITNLDFAFDLPNSIIETGSASASGGGTATVTSTAVAGGNKQTMHIDYASLSGLQTVTFGAYVPQNYQYTDGSNTGGSPVLDPATGAAVSVVVNPAYQFSADAWNGIAIQNVAGDISGATFDAKSLAVQLVADASNALPTQDIHYTLKFEVSDYFGVTGLGLNATLSDGLTFNPSVTPLLSVMGRNFGVSGSGSFTIDSTANGNFNNELIHTIGSGTHVSYQFTAPGNGAASGTTAIAFDVGGLLPGQYGAGTVGSVTFAATVLDSYTTAADNVSNAGGFIREADSVSTSSAGNTATALYDFNGTSYTGTGHPIADDTATPVNTLPSGDLTLTVVEVNGVPYTGQAITPGETVVYALSYTLAQPGDFANLNLAAYLPEPVFSVLHPSQPDLTTSTEWQGLGATTASTFASAGQGASLASLVSGTYTYSLTSGLTGVQVDGGTGAVPANSISFIVSSPTNHIYDNVTTGVGSQQKVTIDFAVTASSLPFVDGLLLTAQADSAYTPAKSGVIAIQKTQAVTLAEPLLPSVQQGIVGIVDDNGASLNNAASTSWTTAGATPGSSVAASAPTLFAAPGSAAVFAGGATIPSTLVAAQDNLDVAGAQAGDTVRLVDAVQDTGHYAAYDVILKDALSQGLSPTNVSNLTFTRGDGTVVVPIDPNTGAAFASTQSAINAFFSGGVLLTVAGDHTQAVLSATGSQGDIVYTTYDVTLPNNTPTAASLTGQAAVVAWTNRDVYQFTGTGYTLNDPISGIDVNFAGNHTLGATLTDTATVQTLAPSITDAITGASNLSDPASAVPANTFSTHNATVVPGETVNLSATISIPQGVTGALTLQDIVPAGLTLISTPGTYSLISTDQSGNTADVTGLISLSGNTLSMAPIGSTTVLPALGGDRPVTLTFNYQALVPQTQAVAVDTSTWGTNATTGDHSAADSWAATQEGISYTTTTATSTATTTGTGDASGQQNTVTITNPLVTASITELNGTLNQHVYSGEIVTYQLTLTNDSLTATAYDLGTSLSLPAGMTYVANSLTYAGGNTAGVVAGGNVGSEGVAGAGNALDNIRLAPGQTIVYTFQGKVDDNLSAGTVLTAKAKPEWESLPANATFDGAGNVNPHAQAYSGAQGSVSNSIAPLTPDLSIIGESNTNATAFDPTGRTTGTAVTVTDGEIVRMRAVLQVPEGQNTADMVVTLPTGLTYANDGSTNIALISPSGGFTTSLTGTGLQLASGATSVDLNHLGLGLGAADPVVTPLTSGITVNGQAVTFNFGTLSNNDHSGQPNYVVVEFNAIVGSSAPAATAVQTGMHGDANSAATSSVSDYVNIQAPNVTLTKQVTGITYNGDGTVTVSYKDTEANSGNAPAYSLSLDDPGAGTGTVNYTGTTGLATPSSAGVSGTHFDAVLPNLSAGQSQIFTYTVTIPSNQINTAVSDATAQATLTSYALNPALETGNPLQETLAGTSLAPHQSSTTATAGLDLVSGTVNQDLSPTQGTDTPLLPLSGQTVAVTFANQTGTEQVTTNGSGGYIILIPDNSGPVSIRATPVTPPAPALDVIDNGAVLVGLVPSGSVSGTNPATLTFTPAAGTNYSGIAFDFWRATDTAPVLANGPAAAFNTTAGASIVPFANATVTDAELDASFGHDFNGTTLTLQRYAGGAAAPDGTDAFTGTGTSSTGVWLSGGVVKLAGTQVGTYSETGGKLSITFAPTGGATTIPEATVDTVLQGIAYTSTAGGNTTLPAIVIGAQIDDANNDPIALNGASTLYGGPHDQGIGGNLLSNVLMATVNVSPLSPSLSIIGESNATAGHGMLFDPAGMTSGTPVLTTDSEIVRMRAVVQLPEGTNTGADIVVTLPTNLVFQKDGSTNVLLVSPNGNATTSLTGSGLQLAGTTIDLTHLNLGTGATDPVTAQLAPGQINQSGQVVTFSLGNITFPTSAAGGNYAVIEFNAVVADNTVGGTALTTAMKGDSNSVATGTVNDYANVAAPSVTLTKTVTNIVYNPDGSATVTYLDTEHNGGNGPAYNLQLDDPSAGPNTSVSYSGTSGPATVASAAPSGTHFDATITSLGANQTQTFTYSVTIPANRIAQAVSDSTAQATLTSSALAAGQQSLANTTLTSPVHTTTATAGLDLISGTVNQDTAPVPGTGTPLVPLAQQTVQASFTNVASTTITETVKTDANGNYAILVPSSGIPITLTVATTQTGTPPTSAPTAPTPDTLDNAAALAASVPNGSVSGSNPSALSFTTAPNTSYTPVVFDFWAPHDTAPVLHGAPAAPFTIAADVPAIQPFANATVSDHELDTSFGKDFSGTTLTLQRYIGNTPSPNAADLFLSNGDLTTGFALHTTATDPVTGGLTGAVLWNGANLGTFNETNGKLVISFGTTPGTVNQATVRNILRNIVYESVLTPDPLVPGIVIGAQIDDANNDPVPLHGAALDPSGPHDQGIGGDMVSNVIKATIDVNAALPGSTFYEPNDANPAGSAVAVASTINTSDLDFIAATTSSVTLAITNARPEDVLTFANTADITGSYSNGVLTLTPIAGHTPTGEAWQDAIRSVTYYNTSDTPVTETRNLAITLTAGANSVTDISTIAIVPVNDSPILDTSISVGLNHASEYQGSGTPTPSGAVGTLVSQLLGLGSNVADGDGPGLTNGAAPTQPGIAITGVSTTDAGGQSVGTWYFSIDNGAHWTAFPAGISDAHPLDLAPDARIAFQPVTIDFNGQIPNAITFRAWDRFDGTANGTQADLSGVSQLGQNAADNSVGSAYSIAKDVLALTIDNVNNAPFASGSVTLPPVSTAEQHPQGQTVGQLFGGGFADPLDQQYVPVANPLGSASNGLAGIAVTGNAATANQGVWEYSLDGGHSWTAIPTDVSVHNAVILPTDARIAFQPQGGFSGHPGALSVNLVDGSGTAVAPNLTGAQLAAEGLNGAPLAAVTGVDLGGTGGSTAFSAGRMTLGTLITPLPPPMQTPLPPQGLPTLSHFPDDTAHDPTGLEQWTTDDYLQRPLIPDLSLVGSVANRFIIETQHAIISVPQNIFVDTLPDAQLSYEAKLPDGTALPSWLSFNPNDLTFSGTPPRGSHGRLEILIRARDIAGNTADANFNILIGREQQDLLGLLRPNRGTKRLMPRLTANPADGLKDIVVTWPAPNTPDPHPVAMPHDRGIAASASPHRGAAPVPPHDAVPAPVPQVKAPSPSHQVRDEAPSRHADAHHAPPDDVLARAAALADLPAPSEGGGFSAALHAAGPMSALGRARAWLDTLGDIDRT